MKLIARSAKAVMVRLGLTVTKLFSELRRNHLLGSKGGELVIMNRLELRRMVHF